MEKHRLPNDNTCAMICHLLGHFSSKRTVANIAKVQILEINGKITVASDKAYFTALNCSYPPRIVSDLALPRTNNQMIDVSLFGLLASQQSSDRIEIQHH